MSSCIVTSKKISLSSIAEGVVAVFAVGILALLFLINLVWMTGVSYDWNEHTYYEANWAILFLPVFIVILGAAMNRLHRWNKKTLFLVCSALYTAAFLYLLFNTGGLLRNADARYVYQGAQAVAAGDYSSLQFDGYLGIYPHQLGLMVYDLLLGMVVRREKILFCANFVEVLVINWCGYQITGLCFEDEAVEKAVILLEFAFLPQFFYTLFGYGLIPGFCCLMIALYHVACLWKKPERKVWHLTAGLLFLVLAVLLKKNYIIGAAAIAAAMVLYGLKARENWKAFLLAAIFLVLPFAAPSVLKSAVSAATGVEMVDGMPSVCYLAMGTDLENQGKAPGWYNEYNWDLYTQTAQYDAELASELAKEKLKENLLAVGRDPLRGAKFYGKKVISTWCDPLFESVWSGAVPAMGSAVRTKLLNSLYTGGKLETVFRVVMKSLVLVLLGTALLFFWFHRAEHPELVVGYLYLIGGFLFHLIWETKSQYVYTYLFLLLPACAYELCALQSWYRKRKTL